MEKFLAKCIANTTVQGINVGKVYCVEHDLNYKIIYNETKKNFESALGNKEWFYEHFEPLRCVCCNDRDYCKVYEDGREYACYGFEEEKERRSSMIQKLEIIQEYKFVKGGSSFYIQIGQKLKVIVMEAYLWVLRIMKIYLMGLVETIIYHMKMCFYQDYHYWIVSTMLNIIQS